VTLSLQLEYLTTTPRVCVCIYIHKSVGCVGYETVEANSFCTQSTISQS